MNNRTRENILILFALALILSIGWIGINGQKKSAPKTPSIETHAAKSSDGAFSFDVEYPSFSGISDRDTEKDLNTKISEYVKNSTESFKQETGNNPNTGNPSLPGGGQNTFFMRYETEFLTSDVVSIRFELTTYAAGAAHPYSFTNAFNYNLRSKSLISSPEGFFMPDSGYLETISSYAISDLLQQFKEDREAIEPMIRGGAAADRQNYQNLLLTKNGLLVVFDPYQVAPYAAGIPEVTIPYEKIAGIMDPGLLSFVSSEAR